MKNKFPLFEGISIMFRFTASCLDNFLVMRYCQ
jgi:hypothetical protein